MLEASANLRRSLNQAREIYDTEEKLKFRDTYNREVARLVDTEWIMMTHDVPMHRLEGEQPSVLDSPWFYSSWATLDRNYDEERQNGDFFQAQLRRKLGSTGLGCSKLEVHTRLVDTKDRNAFSETERAMIIVPGMIAVKASDAENGYRSITPEDEEDWQSMLGALEQLKSADFTDMLLVPYPVIARDSAAA
jgi:hypothetical protein